jgi:hypothetical protein
VITVVLLVALVASGCSVLPDDEPDSPAIPESNAEVVLSQLITRSNLLSSNAGVEAVVALNVIDPGWAVTAGELRVVEDAMCQTRSTAPLEEFVWARLWNAGPEVLPILDSVVVEASERCNAGDAVQQQIEFLQSIADRRAQTALASGEHTDRSSEICTVLEAGDLLGADHLARALARRLGVSVPAVIFSAVMSTCPSWIGPVESVVSRIVSTVT